MRRPLQVEAHAKASECATSSLVESLPLAHDDLEVIDQQGADRPALISRHRAQFAEQVGVEREGHGGLHVGPWLLRGYSTILLSISGWNPLARAIGNGAAADYERALSSSWRPSKFTKAKKRRGEHRLGSSGPPSSCAILYSTSREGNVSLPAGDLAMFYAVSNFTAVKRAALFAARAAVGAAVSSSDGGIWGVSDPLCHPPTTVPGQVFGGRSRPRCMSLSSGRTALRPLHCGVHR
jgi:hypothetical protein